MIKNTYLPFKLNNIMNSKFVKYATVAAIIGGSAFELTDYYSNTISENSFNQKEFLNETFKGGLESKLNLK